MTTSCLYVEPNERFLFVCNGVTRQLLLFKMNEGLGLHSGNVGSAVFDAVVVNMTANGISGGRGDDVIVDMAFGPGYTLGHRPGYTQHGWLYILARSTSVWGIWRLKWHSGSATVTLDGTRAGAASPLVVLNNSSVDDHDDGYGVVATAGYASLEVLQDGACIVTSRTTPAQRVERNTSLVTKVRWTWLCTA